MRGSTFHFAPTKTYDLISVDLEIRDFFSFSLSLFLLLTLTPSPSPLFSFLTLFFLCIVFFFFSLFLFYLKFGYMAQCPSLIWVRFYPETIYFFSVQFSLNELSSSHFLTSEIFVKISSLESVMTYHPEHHKNIPTVS